MKNLTHLRWEARTGRGSSAIYVQGTRSAVAVGLDEKDAESIVLQHNSTLDRLHYLRGEIQAERISTAEIVELQELAPHIDPSDPLLLEWAGVPEHN
jgi:hypothetical protein